jgi:hypothetical protein
MNSRLRERALPVSEVNLDARDEEVGLAEAFRRVVEERMHPASYRMAGVRR